MKIQVSEGDNQALLTGNRFNCILHTGNDHLALTVVDVDIHGKRDVPFLVITGRGDLLFEGTFEEFIATLQKMRKERRQQSNDGTL